VLVKGAALISSSIRKMGLATPVTLGLAWVWAKWPGRQPAHQSVSKNPRQAEAMFLGQLGCGRRKKWEWGWGSGK
jgi:hypothetical protein